MLVMRKNGKVTLLRVPILGSIATVVPVLIGPAPATVAMKLDSSLAAS